MNKSAIKSVSFVGGLLILVAASVMFLQPKQTKSKNSGGVSPDSVRPAVQGATFVNSEKGERGASASRPLANFLATEEASSLVAAPLPASTYNLDFAKVSVSTSRGTEELSLSGASSDRVMIAEGEKINVTISVPKLQRGQDVVVAASNGGQIERLNGPLQFVAKDASAALDISFTPTLGRGAYTIDIRHAGSVATLNFWAGAPLVPGEPGPKFVALPPPSEIIP